MRSNPSLDTLYLHADFVAQGRKYTPLYNGIPLVCGTSEIRGFIRPMPHRNSAAIAKEAKVIADLIGLN